MFAARTPKPAPSKGESAAPPTAYACPPVFVTSQPREQFQSPHLPPSQSSSQSASPTSYSGQYPQSQSAWSQQPQNCTMCGVFGHAGRSILGTSCDFSFHSIAHQSNSFIPQPLNVRTCSTCLLASNSLHTRPNPTPIRAIHNRSPTRRCINNQLVSPLYSSQSPILSKTPRINNPTTHLSSPRYINHSNSLLSIHRNNRTVTPGSMNRTTPPRISLSSRKGKPKTMPPHA